MKQLLSLKVPGADGTPVEIQAPSGIPTGGLSGSGGRAIDWGLLMIFLAVILLAFAYLMYGGFRYITSSGDKEKMQVARKTIITAIIGLIIAFLSLFLVSMFGNLFGINLLDINL